MAIEQTPPELGSRAPAGGGVNSIRLFGFAAGAA
jgi:hypothetical protein